MSDKPPIIAGGQPVAPAALLQQAEKQRFWILASRLVIALVIVASLALVWWSLRQVDRAQSERASTETQLTDLTRAVEGLTMKWSAEETNRIHQRLGAIEETLVSGEQAVNAWLADLKQQIGDLGYKPEISFQEAVPPANPHEAPLLPTTIRMTAQSSTVPGATSFQRLLRFHRHVLTQPKRADVTELIVSGRSNSVGQAVAVFNLWGRPAGATQPTGP